MQYLLGNKLILEYCTDIAEWMGIRVFVSIDDKYCMCIYRRIEFGRLAVGQVNCQV